MAIYKPTLLDKFKDFVNGLRGNWDQYEAHVADYESHKSKNVSHVIVATRDASLEAGVQAISVPFRAKALICFAILGNSMMHSMGMWGQNNLNRAITLLTTQNRYQGNTYLADLNDGGSNVIRCVVQNVSDTGFELNWTKQGNPTGTITLYILAITH